MKQRWAKIIAVLRDNWIWIVLVTGALMIYPVSPICRVPYFALINSLYPYLPDSIYFILAYYAVFVVNILILFLVTWLIRRNRYT